MCVTGKGTSTEDWQLLPAWLLAYGVEHLVLVDPERLHPAHVAELCGLAATCGLELWLVAHLPAGGA